MRARGTLCRAAAGDCDIAETVTFFFFCEIVCYLFLVINFSLFDVYSAMEFRHNVLSITVIQRSIKKIFSTIVNRFLISFIGSPNGATCSPLVETCDGGSFCSIGVCTSKYNHLIKLFIRFYIVLIHNSCKVFVSMYVGDAMRRRQSVHEERMRQRPMRVCLFLLLSFSIPMIPIDRYVSRANEACNDQNDCTINDTCSAGFENSLKAIISLSDSIKQHIRYVLYW